jgi:pantoate--beta-alanine ligase
MIVSVHTKSGLQNLISAWKEQGLKVGFVPTMGALHDGHISLVQLALTKADRVLVSIFVNPTQFAPHEDFDSYPRQEAQDLEKLQNAGAHAVYLPTDLEIYPDGRESKIKAGAAALGLESDFRPHFFGGVVNIVSRLFDHVRPDVAIFGEKDFQQLCVVREMVAAYAMPIEIVGAPIARDEYGLALSSRNAYLSPQEMIVARTLNKVIAEAGKTKDTEAARAQLLQNGFDKVDYVTIWNDRILAAAWIGKTRLIDNMAA